MRAYFKVHLDCCPRCRTHFRKKSAKIVFKDVAECLRCGSIWVLYDYAEYLKWL